MMNEITCKLIIDSSDLKLSISELSKETNRLESLLTKANQLNSRINCDKNVKEAVNELFTVR